jgi:GLPGLI family protein
MVKESGPKKYLYNISPTQWKQINGKYTGISCKLLNDPMKVGGYNCHKAIISLVSGRQVTAYYTNSFTTSAKAGLVEPLFSCIPGTVLQYEVASGSGIVVFKISEVNRHPIAPEVFAIPNKNIQVKKYSPKVQTGSL